MPEKSDSPWPNFLPSGELTELQAPYFSSWHLIENRLPCFFQALVVQLDGHSSGRRRQHITVSSRMMLYSGDDGLRMS